MNNSTFTWHSECSDLHVFEKGLAETLAQAPKSIIILSCSGNHYPEENINALLQQVNVPVCGGIYTHVFIGNVLLEQGVIFIGLSFPVVPHMFENINDDPDEIANCINANKQLKQSANALMFFDGLMANTEMFLDELYTVLDCSMTIIGGGAGSLDFIQRPCVYTSEGIKADVIQLVSLPKKLHVGIGHGWQILEGPFLVSGSSGTFIDTLNYKDAVSVYKETVENLSDYQFTNENFFEIAQHFPFGIESINGDLLVRDPIVAHDKSIQCVGNVSVNSMVYILNGQKDLLVDSVSQAVISAATCAEEFSNENTQQIAITFDCISRKLYLTKMFQQELDKVTLESGADIAFGVLPLGEIANDSGGAIKLLNKSTVIGFL